MFDAMETETIFGQVIAKANNYLAVPDGQGGRRMIKNDLIRRYEQSFCAQCKIYRNRLINGRFRLKIDVYHSSMRFDLDNSLKTILDCLQMVKAITDDNLCYAIEATKHVDKRNPRIVFGIDVYEPSLFDN
jgi:Holliday junction resolvase RusA-like endonuclease